MTNRNSRKDGGVSGAEPPAALCGGTVGQSADPTAPPIADAKKPTPIVNPVKPWNPGEYKQEWNGRCKCGHLHSRHAPIQSHNWSAGKCKHCECTGFVHDEKSGL